MPYYANNSIDEFFAGGMGNDAELAGLGQLPPHMVAAILLLQKQKREAAEKARIEEQAAAAKAADAKALAEAAQRRAEEEATKLKAQQEAEAAAARQKQIEQAAAAGKKIEIGPSLPVAPTTREPQIYTLPHQPAPPTMKTLVPQATLTVEPSPKTEVEITRALPRKKKGRVALLVGGAAAAVAAFFLMR